MLTIWHPRPEQFSQILQARRVVQYRLPHNHSGIHPICLSKHNSFCLIRAKANIYVLSKWSSAFYTTAQRDPIGENYSPTLQNAPPVQATDPTAGASFGSPLYPSHSFVPQDTSQLGLAQQQPMPTQHPLSYGIEYVTPAAWQDAVASSFATGMKRRRYE
jgi:hypothetical protein